MISEYSTKSISGMMIYYYFVCKRKLWYFCHQVSMEQNNENVKLGKILDESSYIRENKHIEIDGTINIDFIHDYKVLHEVKKSRKIEEAGIWQVKYYLYYLKQRGVEGIEGIIDYPLLKRNIKVILNDEDEAVLESVIEHIKRIIDGQISSINNEKKNICKSCAYYDLCFI